jgi:hypothetical protein
MIKIQADQIYEVKDMIKLSPDKEKKLNAINSLFITIGGNKKKFKNMKDITPKNQKNNIWKNIINKQKTDGDLNIKLLINFWLNKLSTGNIDLVRDNLVGLPYNNFNQLYFIFEQLWDKILNDSNYLKCYVNLLLSIHTNVELNYDILHLLIENCEQHFFDQFMLDDKESNVAHKVNILKVISILYNNKIIKIDLIESIVDTFIENLKGEELKNLLTELNDTRIICKYKQLIQITFINDKTYDLRLRILLNECLEQHKQNVIVVPTVKMNKIENSCNTILEEYIEVQDIHEVKSYFNRKLKDDKDVFCKILLKYWLIDSNYDLLKDLVIDFVNSEILSKNDIITNWQNLIESSEELMIDYPNYELNLPNINLFIKNFSNTCN